MLNIWGHPSASQTCMTKSCDAYNVILQTKALKRMCIRHISQSLGRIVSSCLPRWRPEESVDIQSPEELPVSVHWTYGTALGQGLLWGKGWGCSGGGGIWVCEVESTTKLRRFNEACRGSVTEGGPGSSSVDGGYPPPPPPPQTNTSTLLSFCHHSPFHRNKYTSSKQQIHTSTQHM